MKHPTKKQMQKVIDLMYTILPLTFERKRSLDMEEGQVNCDYECGSVHCFGGWFAVACLEAGLLEGYVTFRGGGYLMANMLGFGRRHEFECWADDNPDIWDNPYGMEMFIDKKAFKSPQRPSGAKDVADIINHLQDVQARLPE